DDGAHPKNEFLGAEGLGEVIVRAECESANAICLLAPGCEHEHRNIRGGWIGAKGLEYFVARESREHEIQDYERGPFAPRHLECIGPGRDAGYAIARAREAINHEGGDLGFVIHDQNPVTRCWSSHARCW